MTQDFSTVDCTAWVAHSANVRDTLWVCEKGAGHAGHHSAYVHGGHLCWGEGAPASRQERT